MTTNLGFDGSGQTHIFTSFPESHQDVDDDDEQNILENEIESNDLQTASSNQGDDSQSNTKHSVWQIEYYQAFFNVNTADVTSRILGSMIPNLSQNYLITKIRPNPDLYGPFWISTTLIFSIAISGNIVSYFHSFGSQYAWQTDFHKVTSSAAAIFAYCWLVPTLVYILMRWRKARADYEFIEVLCVYGYSLSIYIPISVLWLINVPFLQWLFVLIAVCLSGSVLASTFWPCFSQESDKKVAIGVLALIISLHALLGIGFMMYFFHYPAKVENGTTTAALVTSTLSSSIASNITLTS